MLNFKFHWRGRESLLGIAPASGCVASRSIGSRPDLHGELSGPVTSASRHLFQPSRPWPPDRHLFVRREPEQRRPASKGFGLRERASNAEYTSGKLPLAGSKLRADAQEWSKLDSERENKMTVVSQLGGTQLRTATGRYDYHFHGVMSTERGVHEDVSRVIPFRD